MKLPKGGPLRSNHGSKVAVGGSAFGGMQAGAVCVEAHVRIYAGGGQQWSSLPRQPNISTTGSVVFWLTERRRELGGNRQYCGKVVLSTLAGSVRQLAQSPSSRPFRVRVSDS